MRGDPLALQPKCHAKAQKAPRRKCYALLIVVKGALTVSQLEIPLSVEWVKRMILILRGKIAMHDADLVDLYEVKTKALNQALKRNERQFPPDIMFRLTKEEKKNWSQIVPGSKP
jgi:hypothetical protein